MCRQFLHRLGAGAENQSRSPLKAGALRLPGGSTLYRPAVTPFGLLWGTSPPKEKELLTLDDCVLGVLPSA